MKAKPRIIGIFVGLKILEILAAALVILVVVYVPYFIGTKTHSCLAESSRNIISTETYDASCWSGGFIIIVASIVILLFSTVGLIHWFSANWKWSEQIEKRLRRK